MTQHGIFEWEHRLPAWLRPTYRGAFFILGMSIGPTGKLFVLTLLATLLLMGGAVAGLVLFLRLLAVAVVAGGAAGAIQGALHRMDDWGGVGTWLRWTSSIFGYVVVFGFLTPNWPFSLLDPALYVLAAGISTVGAGCLMVVDDRRPGRLTPRRFQLLQNRELMWVSADRAREASPRPDGGQAFAPAFTARAQARQKVREEWNGTMRRSRSKLSWWTRE